MSVWWEFGVSPIWFRLLVRIRGICKCWLLGVQDRKFLVLLQIMILIIQEVSSEWLECFYFCHICLQSIKLRETKEWRYQVFKNWFWRYQITYHKRSSLSQFSSIYVETRCKFQCYRENFKVISWIEMKFRSLLINQIAFQASINADLLPYHIFKDDWSTQSPYLMSKHFLKLVQFDSKRLSIQHSFESDKFCSQFCLC